MIAGLGVDATRVICRRSDAIDNDAADETWQWWGSSESESDEDGGAGEGADHYALTAPVVPPLGYWAPQPVVLEGCLAVREVAAPPVRMDPPLLMPPVG